MAKPVPVRGTNFFQLRIKIDYGVYRQSFGCTEDYWLNTTDPATAQANAQMICAYRTLWLAPGGVIVYAGQDLWTPGPYIQYASLSLYGPGKDSLPVPLNGLFCRPNKLSGPQQDADTPPNDRTSAISYRFTTPQGAQIQQGTRMFRYIPDSWETNIQSAAGFTPPAWVPGNPAIPVLRVAAIGPGGAPIITYAGAAVAWRTLQSYLLNLIVKYCGAPSLLPYQKGPPALQAGSVVTGWGIVTGQPGSPATFTGFSSHRTGAPYGDFRGRAKKRT